MDFLDPKKQRAHTIRLITGYFLIGLAVLTTTVILLYRANGVGLGKDGEIVQYGLVYVSSKPGDAEVSVNGKRYKSNTNTKLQLQTGDYTLDLKRQGYRGWSRNISVSGASLQRFDYPQLFPTNLITNQLKAYTTAPGIATQSPDRRWLLVQQDTSPLVFDLYDLSDPKKIQQDATVLTLPENLLSSPRSGTHGLKLVEWSTDNRHVILEHTFAGGSEYILVDRQDTASSLNLTKTLGLAAGEQLSLRDKKFDKYYAFDPAAKTLGVMSIATGNQVTPLLDQVLAYKSYGSDRVLYVTDKGAAAGKVFSVLRIGDDQSYRIREHTAAAPYLVDLAQYDGDWYIVAGAGGDSKVYVYKNPEQIRKSSATAALVPVQILRVEGPDRLAFSSNTQYIMISKGTNIAVYDIEYDKRYTYAAAEAMDPPVTYPGWMDGNRLAYVSGGKLTVRDYDNINVQTLMPASPAYLPFFDRDYDTVYSLVPGNGGSGSVLTGTSLLIPADQ